MNNQEAKLILKAYRPGGQDAADPLVTEALEQARRDPVLQAWFAEEQAVDSCVQAKLRTAVVVPLELKGRLLALQKIVQPAPWWRQPMKLAAAAAVMLLLGLVALLLRHESSARLDSFRETMVRYSMREREHITFMASNPSEIRHWLQAHGIETNFDLPNGLRDKPVEGCRVVDWNGEKVTLICFEWKDGNHVDLFVLDHAGLPGLAEDGPPKLVEAGGSMTATWTKGGKVYLLTGGGNKTFLQKLLQRA